MALQSTSQYFDVAISVKIALINPFRVCVIGSTAQHTISRIWHLVFGSTKLLTKAIQTKPKYKGISNTSNPNIVLKQKHLI